MNHKNIWETFMNTHFITTCWSKNENLHPITKTEKRLASHWPF